MMSEISEMYNELDDWRRLIVRLQKLAGEMEVFQEQNKAFVTNEIANLFTRFESYGLEADGLCARYGVDFEHPENAKRKLVFEFTAHIVEEA